MPNILTEYWKGVSKMSSGNRNAFLEIAKLCASVGLSIWLVKYLAEKLDPTRLNRSQAAARRKALERRFGIKVDLDQHEEHIAEDVVNPDEIDVALSDIGGLEDTIEELENKVIAPIKFPKLFNSYLHRQAKGVLLFGPPGVGKTLLAKALARESGACFINLKASSLLSKWFGDTQKLVHAVFTLAYKIQPAIIFIDEVDALLGRRREQEHEATTNMKTEFISLWDGFSTRSGANVTVLAATNRPHELDDAVLRRFPVKIEVPLPEARQREQIFAITLDRHARGHPGNVDPVLLQNQPGPSGKRPLQELAEKAGGFSGSDIFELCSQAACYPLHEAVASREAAARRAVEAAEAQPDDSTALPEAAEAVLPAPRPMSKADLEQAFSVYRPTSTAAYRDYTRSQRHAVAEEDMSENQAMAAMMLAAMSRFANPEGFRALENGGNHNHSEPTNGGARP